METFYIAATYFLFGIIWGGIIMTILIFKLYGIYEPNKTVEKEPSSQSVEVFQIPIGQMFPKENKAVNPVLVSEKRIRSIVKKRIDYLKEHEEWTKVSKTTEVGDDIIDSFEERKQWFLSRVGKRITTSNLTCDCPQCTEINDSGTFLETKDSAYTSFLHEIYNKLELKDFEYIDYEARG